MLKNNVYLIEKNIQGAWEIYGNIGIKQYRYTKRKALKLYINDCYGLKV